MANSPELQFNVRARYEWAWDDYNPFVGAAVQYQDESFSSATVVNRNVMPVLDHDGRVVRRQQG